MIYSWLALDLTASFSLFSLPPSLLELTVMGP